MFWAWTSKRNEPNTKLPRSQICKPWRNKEARGRKQEDHAREQSEAEDTVTQEEEQEFDQREEEAGKKKAAVAASNMTTRKGRKK